MRSGLHWQASLVVVLPCDQWRAVNTPTFKIEAASEITRFLVYSALHFLSAILSILTSSVEICPLYLKNIPQWNGESSVCDMYTAFFLQSQNEMRHPLS